MAPSARDIAQLMLGWNLLAQVFEHFEFFDVTCGTLPPFSHFEVPKQRSVRLQAERSDECI